MKKLSKKEYWDSLYKPESLEEKQHFLKRNIKILIKMLLGEKIVEYIRKYMLRSYADYLLWEVIYKKYMPKTKGKKVLEVGSAPGDYLVRLSQRFGFIPYGIEYSESGVEANRKIFNLHNINPDNVIHADFLSDDFHNQYREYFDIVISRGFIEHFTDIKDIIDKHINLLAKGGCLIVSIPNFRGIKYIMAWIFDRELLSMHNIDLMRKEKFLEIFDKERLLTLFCDYYGTFNFWECDTLKRNYPILTRLMIWGCNNLQSVLNLIFHLLFRDKGAENKLFSPYLIFIGVKKK